jgi:hypothetical protein
VYGPQRMAPTTTEEAINDLAEVERLGKGALEDESGDGPSRRIF